MKEQQIQTQIIKYLKNIGGYYIKTVLATRKGTPDIIGCYKGKFIAIEVKMPGCKATRLQQYELDMIVKAGGVGITTTCLNDVKQILEGL